MNSRRSKEGKRSICVKYMNGDKIRLSKIQMVTGKEETERKKKKRIIRLLV